MAEFPKLTRRPMGQRTHLCTAATMLLATMLAGCGSMSPGRGYDRVTDVFTGSPKSTDPYPNLASVPARPAAPSTSQRQPAPAGLIADRNNAQYSEEVLRNPQTS